MDTSLEMLKVINNKIKEYGADNLKTLYFDLEKADLKETTFDLIFNQMVLHLKDFGVLRRSAKKFAKLKIKESSKK